MAITLVRRGGFIGFTGVNQALVNTAFSGNVGDLFIAHICQQGGAAMTLTGSPSWTLGDSTSVGGWAWAIIPNPPSNLEGCTFQWTGAFNGDWSYYEYSGTDQHAPIGATSANSATSTTLSATPITTRRAGSRAIGIVTINGNQVLTQPAPYVEDSAMQAAARGSIAAWAENIANAGSQSDALSQTLTSAPWVVQMLELMGPATTINFPTQHDSAIRKVYEVIPG